MVCVIFPIVAVEFYKVEDGGAAENYYPAGISIVVFFSEFHCTVQFFESRGQG